MHRINDRLMFTLVLLALAGTVYNAAPRMPGVRQWVLHPVTSFNAAFVDHAPPPYFVPRRPGPVVHY